MSARAIRSGYEALEKKDYSRAVIWFKKALQLRHSDAEAAYGLGLAHIGMRNANAAVDALRKAVDLNPGHASAQTKLAELLASSGEPQLVENAERRLEQVLAKTPDDVQALEALALIEVQSNRTELAEKHLQSVLKQFPGKFGAVSLLADLRLRSGDWSGAEQTLRSAVIANPDSADIRVALATVYLARDNVATARREIDEALRLDPRHGPALLESARLHLRHQQHAQAEVILRRASRLDKNPWNTAWASYLMMAGRKEESLNELRRLYEKHPTDRTARTRYVLACFMVGRAGEAEKILQRALAKNGSDLDALLGRTELALRSGKLDAAEADLQRVMSLQPDSAIAHYLLARVHRMRGDRSIERRELSEALRLDPMMLVARVRLSQQLVADGDLRTSFDVLEKAPPAQKKLLPIIVQRNWVLLAMNRINEAGESIRAAMVTAPLTELYLQSAIVHINGRRWREARSDIEHVLRTRPADDRAIELLRTCNRSANTPKATLTTLRALIRKAPANPVLQLHLGRESDLHGDRVGAERAFAAALRLVPEYTAAALALAGLEVASGRANRAQQRLESVLEREPRNVRVLLLSAAIDQEFGKKEAAIAKYRVVVNTDARNVPALNNLAMLLAEDASDSQHALVYAERAKELAPTNPAVDDTLGWVYCQRGLYERSKPYLEAAVKAAPSPRRKYHLAVAYAKTGSREFARKLFAEVAREDPRLANEAAVAADELGGGL